MPAGRARGVWLAPPEPRGQAGSASGSGQRVQWILCAGSTQGRSARHTYTVHSSARVMGCTEQLWEHGNTHTTGTHDIHLAHTLGTHTACRGGS